MVEYALFFLGKTSGNLDVTFAITCILEHFSREVGPRGGGADIQFVVFRHTLREQFLGRFGGVSPFHALYFTY